MITVDRKEIFNIENAIRGMRNPLDSWAKSDSIWCIHDALPDGTIGIGAEDLKLAQKLITAGTEHAKFLRQIFVSLDISAPLYWWSEMDTYKVGTTANSCSTMHTLSKYPITQDMFAFDLTNDFSEKMFRELLIAHLEYLRKSYNDTKNYTYFRLLKQDLPSSFIQKRTWTANYAVLRNIISQRKNHKLNEWREFIDILKTLPYANTLLFYNIGENKNEG